DRIEEQTARFREATQFGHAVGPIPREMQRDAGRRSDECTYHLAVFEFLENVAGFPWTRKAREPRPARPHAPRRHRHPECHRAFGQLLDVDAAPGQLTS